MKEATSWYSDRVEQEVRLVRWGASGLPLLLYPTAGGDAEEAERNGLIGALSPFLDDARLKIYSVDSIAGRAWLTRSDSPGHRAWLQNQFAWAMAEEVVPAIQADCGRGDLPLMTAGASLGALQALASLCRFPDRFHAAIGLSGTYDLEPWMDGQMTLDLYFASPLHFLPAASDTQLDTLRSRFALLATGRGQWEDPHQTERVGHVLSSCGIPHRVDLWGPEWDHAWSTWARMLPQYVQELLRRWNA